MHSALATLLLLTACSVATPEPTPDLQPTVEALVNQRLAEREALVEVAVQKQLEAIRSTPTPMPTPAARPLPTPTPEPTATPVPTLRPTATPRPVISLSSTNWIELVHAEGLLPLIPEWLEPYVIGDSEYAQTLVLSAAARGAFPPPPPGETCALPRAVWQGQEFTQIPSQAWCQFSPTQRFAVLEYADWLGNNIYDWIDQQSGIQVVWNQCPPAGSY
jgi:hypothetical protein